MRTLVYKFGCTECITYAADVDYTAIYSNYNIFTNFTFLKRNSRLYTEITFDFVRSVLGNRIRGAFYSHVLRVLQNIIYY